MSQHSSFTDTSDFPSIGGLPLLPWEDNDFIDEAIDFYRANILFKTYPLLSDTDKLIVFVTIVLNHALRQLSGETTLENAQESRHHGACDAEH